MPKLYCIAIQRMLRLLIAQAEIFACRGIGNRGKRHSHTAIEDKCGWWRRDIPHAVSTSLDRFLKKCRIQRQWSFCAREGGRRRCRLGWRATERLDWWPD